MDAALGGRVGSEDVGGDAACVAIEPSFAYSRQVTESGDESRDLYKVLGVDATASADQIGASFKRLAARLHPDRNQGDPTAAVKFKRVNAAYQVLRDPQKRSQYDDLTRPVEDFDEEAPGFDSKALSAAVSRGLLLALQAAMARDLDVTDDDLAEIAMAWLHKHMGGGAPGSPSQAILASLTPAFVARMMAKMAAGIRLVASRAVAAALDEEAGAGDPPVAAFVEVCFRNDLPKLADHIDPAFTFHLGRSYAGMCRQSGRHPEAWFAWFARRVQDGYWAYRRNKRHGPQSEPRPSPRPGPNANCEAAQRPPASEPPKRKKSPPQTAQRPPASEPLKWKNPPHQEAPPTEAWAGSNIAVLAGLGFVLVGALAAGGAFSSQPATPVPQTEAPAAASAPLYVPPPPPKIYTVQAGDGWSIIAARTGVKMHDLLL